MTMERHRQINLRGQQGSKHVTAEEREAIAAYAGPVQNIPMGKSAFEVNNVWDGVRLVSLVDNPVTQFFNAPQSVRSRAQIAHIRKLQAQGKTQAEIIEGTNLARHTVQAHIRRIAVEDAQ